MAAMTDIARIPFGQRVKAAGRAVVGIFNEQSAKQAYGLLGGIFPGVAGAPPTRSTFTFLDAYGKMPWLRTVASRIAEKVATADWQLYVVRKSGGKAVRHVKLQRCRDPRLRRRLLKGLADTGDLEAVDDHPMIDLLTDANSFLTGWSTRKVTQLHLDLVGEAFWLKERGPQNVIVGLWPIPPHWIASTPTPSNRTFGVNFKAWRGVIPETEFIWFADVDPTNPYGRGLGAAMALGDELEADEYAAKHVKTFFYNRARPDFFVYPKAGSMREPEVQRLEDDWLNKHQGFWRAFKPYFLSREVGVHEFEQNFRAQQFVQLREFERNVVMQTYGVPPEILGVISDSNRSTITMADIIFGRYVLEPRLEFQRTIMQERLVPEFDDRLILEYTSPVQEDKDFHLDVTKAHPEAFSVDELRAMANKPALEKDAGKVHFVPEKLTAMDPAAPDGFIPEEPEPAPNPFMDPALVPTPPGGNGNGTSQEARRGFRLWRRS
jgi:Phage portal protein